MSIIIGTIDCGFLPALEPWGTGGLGGMFGATLVKLFCHQHDLQLSVPAARWSEKATAPHSSPLAWKIPWMEEPGRLQSMRLWRVRHDWATSLSLFTFLHWRGKWQPTPVFLPGESQGRGSLVGCRLWGRTESDTTEATQQQQQQQWLGPKDL